MFRFLFRQNSSLFSTVLDLAHTRGFKRRSVTDAAIRSPKQALLSRLNA